MIDHRALDRRAAIARAKGCFALARSTTFTAERETAIERGIAVAERAGLSLEQFDIPGRAARPAPTRPTIEVHTFEYAGDDLNEALRSMEAALRRWNAAVNARADETVHDARRRNFDRAAAEARARDAQG